MVLAVVRHAESIENADKYCGFYSDCRPYSGQVAHEISRKVVGLTPRGFHQSVWLGREFADLAGPNLRVYTSTYRRTIDTAELAFPDLADGWSQSTALLDEQHYGDATYMTKEELFATYPEGAEDRRNRKHLWLPPGGGESLAEGVWQRAEKFIDLACTDMQAGRHIVAITHHTTILALRALLEARPVTDLVQEARMTKTPSAGVLRYKLAAGQFVKTATVTPP
ncbi:MAG: histidine phosphatase family protein [Pseudonocardiaceae bacterium]